jgi:hypothetical protein
MILQKHDNAAVDGVHDERTSSCMKTRYFRLNWLIPILGIGVVVGGMVAETTYVRLERDNQSAQSLANTLEHLYQDQTISLALRRIHDGEVAAAAQRLDALLCDDVLQLSAGLGSADAQTRAYVGDGFRRIGRVRPKTPEVSASGTVPPTTMDQAEAQRVLALAMGSQALAESRSPGM